MKFSSGRWVLLLALLLYAAVFGLRVAFPSPQNGVPTLWVVPIVFVAVQFGVRAGIGGGFLAILLTGIASKVTDTPLLAASYLPRGLGYILVGAIAGATADRLHKAIDERDAGARHFDLSRDLLCTSDFDGRLLVINDSWERTLGWTEEELKTGTFFDYVHPDDRERTILENEAAAVDRSTAHFTNRYRSKNRGWVWLEWSARVDYERNVIYGVARDVTARHRAETQKREAEERFRRVFDDSSLGMALVEMDGTVAEANESLARILKTDRSSLIGVNTMSEFIDRGDTPAIRRGLQRVIDGKEGFFRREIHVTRYDGSRHWVELTVSLIRDDEGKPLYRLSQVADIDARKRAEEELQRLADYDQLSGVLNRRRFEEELELEFAHPKRANRLSSVLLLDVDDFKQVNDSLGHAAGDRVICALGELLRGRLRTGDVVGRLGGDEFGVLLRRTTPLDAEKVAKAIQETVESDLGTTAEAGRALSVSVGVAHFGPEPGLAPDSILVLADDAMYEAKGGGGNRVVSRTPEMSA